MTRMYTFFKILLIALLLFLSQHIHWSDSELWAIGLAKDISTRLNFSTDYKIFFNALLHLVYEFSSTNLQVIQNSRFLFAGVGILILFLAQSIGNLVAAKNENGFLSFFLLGLSTLFISQGFKVRSDLLAGAFQLLGIFYFLRLQKTKDPTGNLSVHEAVLGIILNTLVLLATPKGVYNIAINFVFIFFVLRQFQFRWMRHYLAIVFIVPAILFFVLALTRLTGFKTAWEFFLNSYQEGPQHPSFWTLESFRFVTDSFVRNGHIVILCLAGILFRKKLSKNRFFVPLGMATLGSLVIILFHNDRLPFFILPHFVFPVLFAGLILTEMNSRRLTTVIVSLSLLTTGAYVLETLKQASNQNQISAQKKIESYLADKHLPLYYDGTAALPLLNKIFVFPAPQHNGNELEVLGVLNHPDLDLVFFGNRLFYYMQPFYLAMEDRFFIEIGPGVFAKSYVMRSSHILKEDEWKLACDKFKVRDKIYLYTGANFLSMRPLEGVIASCDALPPKIATKDDFVAFSPYDPLIFDYGLSFSQIFDHRPYY